MAVADDHNIDHDNNHDHGHDHDHEHDHGHDHNKLQEPSSSDDTVTVLRLKGIITPSLEDGVKRRKRLVVQGVHDLYDMQEAMGDAEEATNDDLSKIVLIGRNLQRARLEASFCEWVGVTREELVKWDLDKLFECPMQ